MTGHREPRIRINQDRVVSLAELYDEYARTHRAQASLPFEEKIRILVDMQRMALTWGKLHDVIVWRI